MKELTEIIEYLSRLLKNPGDFDVHRTVHEDELLRILNNFADNRPPTIDQMIEQLDEEYSSVRTSVELIQKGDTLRTEMMETVFDPEFSIDEVKKYEARISLFNKMIEFDKTLTTLIETIGGEAHAVIKAKKKDFVSEGEQGSAQKLLQKNGKNQ